MGKNPEAPKTRVRGERPAAALEEAERRYRALADNAPVGVFRSTLKGKILYANQALASMAGYESPEEMRRLNAKALWSQPGSRQEFLAALKAKGRVSNFEVNARDRHRESRIVLVSASLENDVIEGMLVDITDRKRAEKALRESEERYRELVEDSADVIWSVDERGHFTYLNPAAEPVLGRPLGEMIGRSFTDFLAPGQDGASLFRQVMAGRELRQQETIFQKASGELVFLSVNAKAIHGPDGRPLGMRGAARDVTEQRQLQKQLNHADRLAALGQMATGIAHDFNNALTTILSLTQTLLLDAESEGQQDNLKTIEQAARDAAQIVRRLQEFAGLRRGKEDCVICDLNKKITEALALTRPRWKHQSEIRGVNIEASVKLGRISPVRATPSALREVLTNLIFNAVDAMPKGGHLTITSAPRPGGGVAVSVSDTGVGMTEEVASRAFDPFFTTKGPGSSGLGLSMAYGIVRRCGGEILVDSIPGAGSTFTIILPAASGEAPQAKKTKASGEARRGVRVLLVDDEPGVLTGTKQLLWRMGHSVTCASSGEEALELFQQGSFDLVITDLGMPGLSGWNVATRILKLAPSTPVGLLTGWSETVDPKMAQGMGIRFVLAKPFDRHELEECVRRACTSAPD